MNIMADISYHPKVQLGSLRQTTKKMMATKVGNAKVGDTKLKKFLKDDKGLRRVAYGDKSQTIESWKGRHYMKEVKGKIETSDQYKETSFGKHHTAAEAFRETVKEEIMHDESAHHTPTKDEVLREKRIEQAKQHLNQYERAREVEKDSEKASEGGGGSAGNAQKTKGGSANPSKAVPLAGGGVPHGASAPHASGGALIGGSIGSSTASHSSLTSLPALFGLRARTLRVNIETRTLFVHVLNAPLSLALFIGRDLSLKMPTDTRCESAGAPMAFENLKANDFVDARGKTVNDEFVVDELYVNNQKLPSFVVDIDAGETSEDIPTAPPDELSIG